MSLVGGAECTIGGSFSQNKTLNNKWGSSLDSNLNAHPSANPNVGNTNTDTIKTYTGRMCNDECQWENIPCNHFSFDGFGNDFGGGGGSRLEDDCETKTTTYTSFDLTVTVQVTEDCNGEKWISGGNYIQE